jgi:3-hydroxybutyryl-CoA dehydrogenase
MDIRKIGVIGAGQMGNGIAHVAALAGIDVVLHDLSEDRIKSGLATINGNLSRQLSKNLISEEDRQKALLRIDSAPQVDGLRDCDLIIEAATENEQVKVKIFQSVCPIAKPDAILATNTSSISITRLASTTDRPERFIGIHFMNPVPVMQLVELIRGIATEDDTFEASRAFCLRLGKTIAVAEDFPAFIVNRILLPMINEAIYTLYEGVRHCHAARRQSSDGPPPAGRFHRSRHLPVGHAGALRRPRGFEVPPLPSAGEICRGRLARPEVAARLLRLPRRASGPDALIPFRAKRTPSRVSGMRSAAPRQRSLRLTV